jgi:cytidine deaminase
MKYDIIYSIATDTVRNRALNRVTINQNDTISVVYTSSGATYVGNNTMDIKNGKLVNSCSEKDAIKNMLTQNENTIQAIVTINAFTLTPILPCSECVDLILSLNPENTKCLVVSPNKKYISIGDVANYEQNAEDIEGFADSLELDPLSAISPMNTNASMPTTNGVNAQYMNVNNMTASRYMPNNNGMVSQYVPNGGMVSQYMPNNGMVSQYVPNGGMVSQYMPNNNGMVSQYIPNNNGMVSQYIPNNGSQYIPNGMGSQYIPNGGITSQYMPNMNETPNHTNYLNKKLSNLLDIEGDDDDSTDTNVKANSKGDDTADEKVSRKELLRLAKEKKRQAKRAMKIDEQFRHKA